jgi:threonine dehydratase
MLFYFNSRFAVEVETAAPLSAAWASGSAQKIDYITSFVDGIGGNSVIPQMFEIARTVLDGVVTVSLQEIATTIKVSLFILYRGFTVINRILLSS